MLGRTRRIHFVGIGGSGMSGIAELLANLGYDVTGSDEKRSSTTERLERLGVRVWQGHAAAQVGEADVVVVSSAVRPENPEVVEARSRHVPVIPRAEMLAELMRLRRGIAVAGAHGKTSTTSMIAHVLERGGLDPTAVIGGRLSTFGSNARLGRGEWIVVEADESDGSFLKLSYEIAVITNVDREHLDHYGTFERVCEAFVDFANRVPFYGAVVINVDDPALAALGARMGRRTVTYALDGGTADVTGRDIALRPFGAACEVDVKFAAAAAPRPVGRLALQVPGRHNLKNALAAVAVGLELGLTFEQVAAALADFRGAERRFQLVGEVGGVMVVDDYGHHPTEIGAVIAAARACDPGRLVVAFQPHRYTRTRDLLDEFVDVLATADEVVLTDIYAAAEAPIPGVSSEALAARLAARLGRPVQVVRPVEALVEHLAGLVRPGDLVVTLGAGSIGHIGEHLVTRLTARQWEAER
ncbi:MAG: UDP-N-acetylmuramate--L-alanine ligase [Vicinamibacteraceae bacterium]|nr:UDP-N-acetylmuramate--L-alanine ligase [Vicinamibacteraceae bacterium]